MSNKVGLGPVVVLGVHAVVAAVLLVAGLSSAAGSDGWSALASVAVALMVGSYVLGIGLSWLACRFVVRNPVGRFAVAALGPPLPIVILVLFIRWAG